MNSPVLDARDIERTYKQGQHRVEVLRNLNLRVSKGEQLAIIGSSGCGKSTLLHVLAGLDTPDAGTVHLDDVDMYRLSAAKRGKLRNKSLGFVYQFHHLLPEFSALENVAMPLLIGRRDKAEASDEAVELLTKVGLAERLHHKPAELSGGERQRAAIARA
ncbi:MAG: ATP-binding cassette domain-containing protein, partial [Pseudomonadota bacterium]